MNTCFAFHLVNDPNSFKTIFQMNQTIESNVAVAQNRWMPNYIIHNSTTTVSIQRYRFIVFMKKEIRYFTLWQHKFRKYRLGIGEKKMYTSLSIYTLTKSLHVPFPGFYFSIIPFDNCNKSKIASVSVLPDFYVRHWMQNKQSQLQVHAWSKVVSVEVDPYRATIHLFLMHFFFRKLCSKLCCEMGENRR